MKLANFTLNDVKDLGIKCGERLWSSSKSSRERLHGGRQKLSDEKINEIHTIMEENSTISSFKSVNVRKRAHQPSTSKFEVRTNQIKLNDKNQTDTHRENVRCRSLTLIEAKDLYDKKMADNPNNEMSRICYDTFRKYILKAKKYKKPSNVSVTI